ncbi:uncharacterized protein LOC132728410 [Ruditapes philippinarum]|uniref:uncharacterized protein LOC132728410 n=1 Tax=Ruditapes philippinarum TaxID=129788 RepID=UPI00295BDDBF|nr:uncharacterized protein LOC132728410 [Ruditapes philippinarum]
MLAHAVFLALYLICNIKEINGMTCLECADIPGARDCDTVKECGPHEVCFSTQLVSTSGHIYRRMGCRDRMQCSSGIVHKRSDGDLPVCDGCCDSLWCQANLCQDQVYETNRGPICYSCEKQLEDENCTKITECSRDSVCVETYAESSTGHKLRKTACFSKSICERIYGSNSFHQTNTTCFNCCKGDLCNSRCDMKLPATKPPVVTVTQPAQTPTQAGCTDSTPEATCKLAASIVCTDQIHAQNANCEHYCGFC